MRVSQVSFSFYRMKLFSYFPSKFRAITWVHRMDSKKRRRWNKLNSIVFMKWAFQGTTRILNNRYTYLYLYLVRAVTIAFLLYSKGSMVFLLSIYNSISFDMNEHFVARVTPHRAYKGKQHRKQTNNVIEWWNEYLMNHTRLHSYSYTSEIGDSKKMTINRRRRSWSGRSVGRRFPRTLHNP